MSVKLSDQILAADRHLREKMRLVGCLLYVQEKLGCTYNRAALVLAVLEETKVLSEPDHAGHRRWLMDRVAAVEALRGAI